MTILRRTERRWATAVLSGLAASIALACGCGQSTDPPSPEPTQRTLPHPKSATMTSDASDASMLAPDADDEPSVEIDAAPDAGPDVVEAAATEDEASGPGGPAVCGFSACAPGAPCPDLIIDQDDLRKSIVIGTRTFAPTDCAVVEGCIAQTGTRRLLRFDTATANVGTGDLVVGSPMAGVCFEFSQCHQHYHFLGFSQYTLYQPDGTTVAAMGHKQSFCLDDVEQAPQAPGPQPDTLFSCQNQGIHVGWEDVYPNDIDCQWVDITGVPPGTYVLTVAINTAGYLPESNYENDSASTTVVIPPE